MTLLESLLDAIVRLEGDALVMHVGEKPYVVTISAAMNAYRGPLAWGQVELSSKVLTSDAVLGMLGQILPLEQRQALEDFGAVEHDVPASEGSSEHFSIIAARGGDDVWLELRRKPKVEEPIAEAPAADTADSVTAEQDAVAYAEIPPHTDAPVEQEVTVEAMAPQASHDAGAAVEADETPFEIVPDVQQASPTDADVNALLEASAAALLAADVPAARLDAVIVDDEPSSYEMPLSVDEGVAPMLEEVDLEVSLDAIAEPAAEVEHAEAFSVPAPAAESERQPAAAAPPPQVTVAEVPVAESEPQPEVPVAAAPPVAAPEPARPSIAAVPPILQEGERESRAVVLPLARSAVRSDAPAISSTATPVQGFSVEELLRVAAARGASTVYVVAQSQPMVRADGEINALDIGSGAPLSESDVNRLVLDLAPAAARDAWQRGESAEWMCDVADVGRVRCLTFREHRGPGLIFRMIPPRAISADQLGLTPAVQALCSQSDGLVLVTGPRASGKSTLMSAFVDLINRTRSDHVVTIESQIGFVHESRRSFVSQREVRGDGEAIVSAVRAALREDPDVMLIEDLRSPEIAAVALEAAESGRLVFGSLPAASTVPAIERFLELFPADRRAQAQSSLAGTLRGVVAQVLLRRSRGGRVAAREVLLNTPPVAALIEEGKTIQLPLAIESGRRHGMMPLNDALAGFVRDGTVHVTEAYLKAFDKEGLLSALKREGVDTSFAERLA